MAGAQQMTMKEMKQKTSTALLKMLDPDGLDWLASRYTSAEGLQIMIKRAQTENMPAHVVAGLVQQNAAACRDADGADYGFIPMIGAPYAAVWAILLARYARGN